MDKRAFQRWSPVVIVVFLLLMLLLVKQCQQDPSPAPDAKVEATAVRGLNRNPETINYSKHARCRMECRKIDEAEVKDILARGTINYKKSEIGSLPDCKRKYAVEGTTKDRQKVRIIFAPCKTTVTVVTVIDIGKDWPCDCD